MVREVEISISPADINNEDLLLQKVSQKINIDGSRIRHIKKLKRSLDARQKYPLFRFRLQVFIEEDPPEEQDILSGFQKLEKAHEVIIIGAGPAGYFAALELIEKGIRPIILERGKDVQSRRRDLRAIQQFSQVNPDSNYCFGEGGAGTYSDGKLYTRSHKRGKIVKVLQLLVEHGAKTDILVDAHPHIGSNKLPGIIKSIRETIEQFGGQVHFGAKVIDLIIQNGQINGVLCEDGTTYPGTDVILATGHSARDIFYLIESRGLRIESKDFALGVRIEHPQQLIDQIQYNQKHREANLPASSYSLACQVDGQGVFSFCMCPGGMIVPAATNPGEIVLNGMSLSGRNSRFANAGTVVSVSQSQLNPNAGIWAALDFQKEVEQRMFKAGDGSQKAPAQRLTDFVERRNSPSLNECSYIPGIFSAPLHDLLPEFIYDKLRQGILQFEKKMRGYYTSEANVLATESRTSSPIRIPRDKETLMHPDCAGLYPSGEGAGYAGGILSAAMDGQRVAKKIASLRT